ASGVSFAERIRAAQFFQFLRRISFRLEEDMPVAALLARERQNGRRAHSRWRPLCVSALNTPPELASANVFLAVLRDTLGGDAEASDLLLARLDLSQLFPEPAAAFVRAHRGEVRLKETVRDLPALRAAYRAVIL